MKFETKNKSCYLRSFGSTWPAFYCYLLGFLFFAACNERPIKEKESSDIIVNTPVQANINSKVFETEAGWGYDIFRNGKRYIHQKNKPAVGGNKGFDTQEQAQKVAELVMHKIDQGIAPPSVQASEVDSLIQLYNQ